MRYPEEANPQSQKVGERLPGAGGGGMGNDHLMGTKVLLGVMKMFQSQAVVMVVQLCEYTKNH